MPTLTKDEAQKFLSELMLQNSNCLKPCFWGFSPEDVIDEGKVLDFFALLREKPRKVKENGSYQYVATIVYKEFVGISATFYFDNKEQTLSNVYASIHGLYYPEIVENDWQAFRPDTVLKTYGKPSSIEFFLSYPTEPTTDLKIGYEFLFRYANEKFVILYTGQRILNQPQLRICPLEDPTIESVYLFLGDNLKVTPGQGKILQDVTSLSIDEFYNALVEEKSNACFLLDRAAFDK